VKNGEAEAPKQASQKRSEASSAQGRTERAPAFYRRRKSRDPLLLGQLLIQSGDIAPKHLRRALKLQNERGGQLGRILVRAEVCSEAALAGALLRQVRGRATEGKVNTSMAARENPAMAGLQVSCSPLRTTLALVVSDAVALALSVVAAETLSGLLHLVVPRHGLGQMLPLAAAGFSVLAFWAFGLYAAMAKSPPDELRDSSTAITFVFVVCAGMAVVVRGTLHAGAVTVLLASWVLSMVLAPLARALVRERYAHEPWWGHPVVVLGAGRTGRLVVRTLREHPRCGLKPVVVLDDDRSKHGTLRASVRGDELEVNSGDHSSLLTASLRAATDLISDSVRRSAAEIFSDPTSSVPTLARVAPAPPPSSLYGERPRGMFAEVDHIPVVGKLEVAPILGKRLKIPYAIVAMPGQSSEKLVQLVERVGGVFSHLLIIPDLFGFASLGVPAREVGGILGLEVKQQLLLPWPRFAKRAMDIVLTGLGGLVVLPLVVLLTLLIKIDSRGPAFYVQDRLGKDGRRFAAYKFRTMHGDGEARLRAVLEGDPKLRAEYEEFHKLSRDPRVTRVGRVLRRFSLDELPQLYNVLRGDMSLVGPRPYLEREIPDMEQKEKVILRAPPGLTGLWQVSDRNATGFDARVKIDVHYVRNWSVWLDLYVLARTFGVVLKGTGS
jgi:lipopolysaccharide/colanic/teichoic acid biosynthesis glycosyltransferase